jgi:hypothetical protein
VIEADGEVGLNLNRFTQHAGGVRTESLSVPGAVTGSKLPITSTLPLALPGRYRSLY